uniref:F-box domain-containing protein n=1 Tax=Opuntia streptacantha TaxID=393608 RepID=A0A7C9A1D0_OPUST
MGAHMSSPAGQDTGGGGLGDMPESCIAAVLGHLDPPEICRLARLNRAFRGASSADFIWESKLPPNYCFLIHKLFNLNHINHDDHDDGDEDSGEVLPPALVGFTKKDIFACLSRPNLFDDGTKAYSSLFFLIFCYMLFSIFFFFGYTNSLVFFPSKI